MLLDSIEPVLHRGFIVFRPLVQFPADAFPSRVIPDPLPRYLHAQDSDGANRPLVDRYEFLVYRLLRNGLEAGEIFCRDSVRFRSFEDDLLDRPEDVLAVTTPVLSGLLHLEFRWWSQFTTDVDAEASRGGPETCWDTARAGLLSRDDAPPRFGLDLGADTLLRPLLHVFPRRVEVRMVIDRPPDEALCALLAAPVEETTNELLVDFPERLPYPDRERFVKIGGEWIRYSGLDGKRLTGIKRGVRDTLPRAHAAGARLHSGREVQLVIPLRGRDCWNG